MARQTFQLENINTITIFFINEMIRLQDIIYALDCNANFISLRQLYEINIIFINNKDSMALMWKGQKLA